MGRNQRPEWKVTLYISTARGSALNCLGGNDWGIETWEKSQRKVTLVKGEVDKSIYLQP